MNKTVKLYNDTVTIFFNEKARNRYVVEKDGHSPVGTTTVLQILSKPALMTWPMYEAIEYLKKNGDDWEGASKAYLKKSDKGKDTGTAIHAKIENFLKSITGESDRTPVSATEEIIKAWGAFHKWFTDSKAKPLAVENIVYSKKYDFAGTYDCLLEIDGKVVLCDIKTNNASRTAPLGVYSEHFLQLGAYSLAHHEENPMEVIEDLQIIRVGKDGVLNTLRASEVGLTVAACETAFAQLLSVYKVMTPLAKTLKEKK